MTFKTALRRRCNQALCVHAIALLTVWPLLSGSYRDRSLQTGWAEQDTTTVQLSPAQKVAYTKQALGALRLALRVYARGDSQGRFPPDLNSLIDQRIMKKIPPVHISGSRHVVVGPMPGRPISKTGDWYYDPEKGLLRVGIEGPDGERVPITLFLQTPSGVDPWGDW